MVTCVLWWHREDAFKMRHVETYYAQKTTAACPGSFHPLSPHAKQTETCQTTPETAKRHRAVWEWPKHRRKCSIWSNRDPLDTLSKLRRSQSSMYTCTLSQMFLWGKNSHKWVSSWHTVRVLSYIINMNSSSDYLMGIWSYWDIWLWDTVLVKWSTVWNSRK